MEQNDWMQKFDSSKIAIYGYGFLFLVTIILTGRFWESLSPYSDRYTGP